MSCESEKSNNVQVVLEIHVDKKQARYLAALYLGHKLDGEQVFTIIVSERIETRVHWEFKKMQLDVGNEPNLSQQLYFLLIH